MIMSIAGTNKWILDAESLRASETELSKEGLLAYDIPILLFF